MKIKFLLTLVALLLTRFPFAQGTFSIVSSVGIDKLACVNDPVTYTLNSSYPSGVCSVTWQITAGTGTYVSGFGPSSNPTKIRWADQKPNKGTIKATVKHFQLTNTCNSGYEFSTVSRTTVIRSVLQESITGIVSPRDVQYCTSPQVLIITTDPLYIKNTGSGTSIPLTQVERYQWTLPTGWKQAGTANIGTILTSASTISIEPQNPGGYCTQPGDLKVYGIAGGYSQCVSTPTSASNEAKIVINRTPILNLTPQSGFTVQTCGRRDPVIFTATSIPCTTSYSWTYSGGWNGPATTTTNSVSVSPIKTDGTVVNSTGSITVAANIAVGNCALIKSYDIGYSNAVPVPTVSVTNGNYEWCNYEAFSFSVNVPPGYQSNFGFDWYADGGILINGVAYIPGNLLHTTTNTTTVTIPGSAYGIHGINVRMNDLTCPQSNVVGLSKRIGTYNNNEFSIIGPSSVCANQVADFRSNFITPDVTSYQWSAPAGWSNSGQGTPYFSVSVPTPFFGGAITLRLQNRCGLTNTPYVLPLYNTCGFSFTASPNPADETIVVSDLDPDQETSAVIVDRNSNSQRMATGKAGKLELDVKDLPNGLYVLQLKQKNITESQQIMIKH